VAPWGPHRGKRPIVDIRLAMPINLGFEWRCDRDCRTPIGGQSRATVPLVPLPGLVAGTDSDACRVNDRGLAHLVRRRPRCPERRLRVTR